LENYGTLTLEQVVKSNYQYIDEQERLAQDTYMLYKCLMVTLLNDARKKLSIWSDQYQIGANEEGSGVALLREGHLVTNATSTNQIRTKLSSLDTYIITIGSDIGIFNQYVKLHVQLLTAQNETTSDLLINLFKGCGVVSNEVFCAFLRRRKDDHAHEEEQQMRRISLHERQRWNPR